MISGSGLRPRLCGSLAVELWRYPETKHHLKSNHPQSSMPEWPTWWDWELELSSHLFKRMLDRDFTEVDLRRMLSVAIGLREDIVPGRWRIETRYRRQAWEVIVEPETDAHLLVVVTAYRIDA